MSDGVPEPFEDRGNPLRLLTGLAIAYVVLWGGAAILSPFIDVPWVDWEMGWLTWASVLGLVIAVGLIAKGAFDREK